VTAAAGTREEHEYGEGEDEAVLAVYRERFGIELGRVPVVGKADGRD